MALLFMGIIFGALGITFLIVGQGDSIVTPVMTMLGFTFTPIGVLLAAIGVVMMRGSGRRQQLLQTGLPGTATVTALSDTGVTVNDSPLANISFLVQVPGRPPYPVQKRMTLPRLMVGRVAPGFSLPVKVDPANPQEIAIDWNQPNVAAGDMSGLMGAAYGQPAAYGQAAAPDGGYGASTAAASGGYAAPDPTAAGYGAPPAAWGMPQGFMNIPTTVIDASGGGQPVVLSAGGGLDQATLDRINRALYQHGLGGAALGGAAVGAGAPGAGSTAPGLGGAPGASATAPAASGFGLLDPKQAERLSAVGYSGRATIDAFQDTGVATGDAHLYTFGLTVKVEGRPDAEVRYAAMVPQRAVGRIVQGATLPVRVDPLDTSQLLVEWDNG